MLYKVKYRRDGYVSDHTTYVQAFGMEDAKKVAEKELNKFPKRYEILSIKPHKYTHLTN
jgi:hypothetical protein